MAEVHRWIRVATLLSISSSISFVAAADHGVSKSGGLQAVSQAAATDTTSIEFACGHLVVRNDGAITWPGNGGLSWSCAPSLGSLPIYQGSFMLAGDSGASGAVFRSTLNGFAMFVPRPAPYSGNVGWDEWEGETLGYARQGGCPGVPQAIAGEIVVCQFTDSLGAQWGVPQYAGIDIRQTVVSSNETPYGDFVLFRWELLNRDNFAKGPWHAGTFIDWDISGATNAGRYSDGAKSYFFWNSASPGFACGMLDPDQPSTYSETDPLQASPHRIWSQDINSCNSFFIGCWGNPTEMGQSWNRMVNAQPFRSNSGPPGTDIGGVLANAPITLPGSGSASIHQAMYFVDASSNSPGIIEANAVALARRAARWAGFARGDVNDDGLVDLADVCWVESGLPIYPDTYCGDVNKDGTVDAADITYLMNYVSGAGPGPLGEWRFIVPPIVP